MPDDIHLLFKLGDRLRLAQTIGKLKVATRPALAAAGLQWQSNYREHRLRPFVDSDDFALYIFLNPYRKSLIDVHQAYPWWTISRHCKPSFWESLVGGKHPPREWLETGLGAAKLVSTYS